MPRILLPPVQMKVGWALMKYIYIYISSLCLPLGYDTMWFVRSIPLICWYPPDTRISNLIHTLIPNFFHRQKMLLNNMTSMRCLVLKYQWIYMNSMVTWCWHHKFVFQLMGFIVTFSCKHINTGIYFISKYTGNLFLRYLSKEQFCAFCWSNVVN